MAVLIRWEWLVFLLPLAFAVFLGLAAAVGVGMDDGDADHDIDHDIDHEGLGETVLELLGVGKVPLSVLLLCLLVYWSVLGAIGNALLGLERIGWTIALAAVGTPPLTGWTARLIGRWLPASQSFSVARHELVGVEGIALYPITEAAGTVRLHDRLGTLRQLDSRVRPGQPSIAANERVVVTDYDPGAQIFYVERPESLFGTSVTPAQRARRG